MLRTEEKPTTDQPAAPKPRTFHAFGLAVPRPLTPDDAKTTTLAAVLVDAMERAHLKPEPGDVLAVSSKVTALFEGRTVRLDNVHPSLRARIIAKLFAKDPRKLELMLEDAGLPFLLPMRFLSRLRRTAAATEGLATEGIPIAEGAHRLERFVLYHSMHATILNEAGIDLMNSPEGYLTRLPVDPCASARRLREELRERLGLDLPIVITDSYCPIGRVGTLDLAIGFSGLDPMERKLFVRDLFGELRTGDANIVVDTVAAMAGGVMGQTTEMTPAALVRGVATRPERTDTGRTGMDQLAYPKGTAGIAVVLAAFATLSYYLTLALTWPIKRRSRAVS